jgi:hypothetical protein
MIGIVAKLWFAVAALAFGASVVYFVASDGEWFGSFVLGSLVVGSGLLGGLSVATGDGDRLAAMGRPADVVPVLSRRSLPAAWPVLVAVGIATTLIGLAGGTLFFWAGIGLLVLVLGEWLVQGWAWFLPLPMSADVGIFTRSKYVSASSSSP